MYAYFHAFPSPLHVTELHSLITIAYGALGMICSCTGALPPLPKDVTSLEEFPPVQLVAEHAIGCLLVAEHSYFLMQHGHHVWMEVLSLAVEEYKTSNKQTTISKAVRRVFHEHGGNMDSLCEAIINIIIDNRMYVVGITESTPSGSWLFLRSPQGDKVNTVTYTTGSIEKGQLNVNIHHCQIISNDVLPVLACKKYKGITKEKAVNLPE
ncbi:hypothetical protein F5141DRAFT_1060750 [Pisolithus sp. B1]|nr:hypothetical protein F5141DRAFT_1060750 [Pisolithus sp. B1]